MEKIQALWSQRYSGSDGWKTAVLDQGADFQVIGSSMEQIRFTDVQAAGRTGLPPPAASGDHRRPQRRHGLGYLLQPTGKPCAVSPTSRCAPTGGPPVPR